MVDRCNGPFLADTVSHRKKRYVKKTSCECAVWSTCRFARFRAFALRRSDKNRLFLIAISDRATQIAWFSMSRDEGERGRSTGIRATFRSSQVRSFPSITLKSRRSAPTVAGAFCCSRKHLPSAELIDPKELETVASIHLVVEGRGKIARAWVRRPERSLGEG